MNNKLTGIGGWLILPAIGIVVSIFSILFDIITAINDVVLSGDFTMLTSPDSGYYMPGFYAAFIIESILNIFILLAVICLAYFFFTKHYKTPKLVIAVLIAYLIIMVLDQLIVVIFLDLSSIDIGTFKEIGFAIIRCVILIPYFLVSKRVKNTFVNGRPNSDTITHQSTIVN